MMSSSVITPTQRDVPVGHSPEVLGSAQGVKMIGVCSVR